MLLDVRRRLQTDDAVLELTIFEDEERWDRGDAVLTRYDSVLLDIKVTDLVASIVLRSQGVEDIAVQDFARSTPVSPEVDDNDTFLDEIFEGVFG